MTLIVDLIENWSTLFSLDSFVVWYYKKLKKVGKVTFAKLLTLDIHWQKLPKMKGNVLEDPRNGLN